jgi:DNA mismatch repair protein MSH6
MIVKRLPCQPQLSQLAPLSALAARDRLERYRAAHPGKLTPAVEEALRQEGPAIVTAGAMKYLEDVLLAQRVLPFATWEVMNTSSVEALGNEVEALSPTAGKRMMMDAAALGALEVLETLEGSFSGSLLHFLNHTATPGGFRLLKLWVCAPLLDPTEIRTRSDAVEHFIVDRETAEQLWGGLKKIAGNQSQRQHDLERATSRVWGFAAQSSRHAVMYEDTTAKRLGDFMALLQAYEQNVQLISSVLSAGNGRALPGRLADIAKTTAEGGSFPSLLGIIRRLSGSVVEGADPKTGKMKFRPVGGADPQYDAATAKIEAVQTLLDRELQGIKACDSLVACSNTLISA